MSCRCRIGLTSLLCTAALAVFAAAAAAAPPANDARIAPQKRSLPAVADGTTVGATLEQDEPASQCGAITSSVWFSFTVAGSRDLLVALDAASDMDATAELFQRERSQLTSLMCWRVTGDYDGTRTTSPSSGGTATFRVVEPLT
jgi:hypothetical protein